MMEFYRQTFPLARKPHQCDFCSEIIKKGEQYSYEVGKYEGEMFYRSLCLTCEDIMTQYVSDHMEDEVDWNAIMFYLQEKHCGDCEGTKDMCRPQNCVKIRGHYNSPIYTKLTI